MGQCFSRAFVSREVGPEDAYRVSDLSPTLRRLVQKQSVLFWYDTQKQRPAFYLRLVPPFMLTHAVTRRQVVLSRSLSLEGRRMLVLEGTCANTNFELTVHVEGYNRRNGPKYMVNVRWVKPVDAEREYSAEYELMLHH
jgi:hypothetical protein